MPALPHPALRLLATVLAVLAWTGPMAAQAPPAAPARTTLAVLPLRGAFQVPRPGTGADPALGADAPPSRPAQPRPMLVMETQIYQRITMALFRTGRFQLIEREQLPAVLREGAFEHAGLVDDATAAALGKQAGASQVLVGTFTGGIGHSVVVQTGFFGRQTREESWPGHLEVRLRLVATEPGAISEPILVHAPSQDSTYYHAYEKLLDDLTRALELETAARFPMTGTVIKVLSDREVLVDLGRAQQLKKGAGFQLVEQGEAVVHPVTGRLIQGERRVLTELKVAEVGEESSTLRISGSRVPLRVGQQVVQAGPAAP